LRRDAYALPALSAQDESDERGGLPETLAQSVTVEMKRIDDLPNNGIKVLLMRRTGTFTMKCAVGFRDAFGRLQGWTGIRLPTHWDDLPPFAKSKR
jgi:hypothetical protein